MRLQDNTCPLCAQKFKDETDAVLDHDHNTGLIRGALHDSCNRHLGFIEGVAKHSNVAEVANRVTAYVYHHQLNPSNLVHPRHENLRKQLANPNKIVKLPRLLLTSEEKLRFKAALKEGALPHPNPKKKTSREGSWNRTAKKYSIQYDRLLAYVNGQRPLSELE